MLEEHISYNLRTHPVLQIVNESNLKHYLHHGDNSKGDVECFVVLKAIVVERARDDDEDQVKESEDRTETKQHHVQVSLGSDFGLAGIAKIEQLAFGESKNHCNDPHHVHDDVNDFGPVDRMKLFSK